MGFIGKIIKKDEKVGEGVGFDRIRRVTGYLVGTLDRFNDGKKAEERDRVKHGMTVNTTAQTITVELPVMECPVHEEDKDSFCPKG